MSLSCPFCSNGPKNCKCPPDKITTFTTFTTSPSTTDVSTSRGKDIGSNFLKDEKERVLCPGCNDPVKAQDVAMLTNQGPWHRHCAMATNSIGGNAIRESEASARYTEATKDIKKINLKNACRYFDPSQGTTYNQKCPCCNTDTWAQESIHTCYEGKKYFTNQINLFTGESEVVGVMHGIPSSKFDCTPEIWCEDCYIKEFKPGREFTDG